MSHDLKHLYIVGINGTGTSTIVDEVVKKDSKFAVEEFLEFAKITTCQ